MELNAIVLENVTKKFSFKGLKNKTSKSKSGSSIKKELIAIDKVSLTVPKGQVFGVIGHNGSGKTTLLRIIAGLYEPDSGSVLVNGSLAPILKIGIGFHDELSAKENILINGMLLGMPKNKIQKRFDSILEFAELEQFSEMKLKHFSSGMRARLAISTTLNVKSDIILIDETMAVGDIAFKEKCLASFKSLKKQGNTIIITSHAMNFIAELTDQVLLLYNGKAIEIGEPNEVIKKYKTLPKNPLQNR